MTDGAGEAAGRARGPVNTARRRGQQRESGKPPESGRLTDRFRHPENEGEKLQGAFENVDIFQSYAQRFLESRSTMGRRMEIQKNHPRCRKVHKTYLEARLSTDNSISLTSVWSRS